MTKEEKELINGCVKGKEACQKQLYLEYGPLVRGVCLRYAADEDEANDMFHDIFVFILTHFNEFKHITSLKGWLYRITLNKVIDHFRDPRKKTTNPTDSFESVVAPSSPMIPEILTKEQLMKFINELPEKRRIAFNLAVIDDLPQDEICKLMNETPTNVRTLISRSKESLRNRIRDYLNHEEFEL